MQLLQLLNHTPLGAVANERTLYRHRARAGLRIGDGRHIDLLRYVAWLVLERHRPRPELAGLTGYEAHKERAAQRASRDSLVGFASASWQTKIRRIWERKLVFESVEW